LVKEIEFEEVEGMWLKFFSFSFFEDAVGAWKGNYHLLPFHAFLFLCLVLLFAVYF